MSQSLQINISGEKLITFLVDDFLDLAQVREGLFCRIDKNFVVHQLIEEVISILDFKAKHKSITVKTHYTGLDQGQLVRCDERRLTQVIMNLLSNALKFTPVAGLVNLSIKLIPGLLNCGSASELNSIEQSSDSFRMHPRLSSYHDDADMLEVAITDNGTGIKEEDMPIIFEKFGKLKENREINTRGIGLGLHIC